MKNVSVILLAAFGLVFAAAADAAPTKKKRTRNASRIGPYGMGMVGQSKWSSDQSVNEQELVATLEDAGAPIEGGIATSTEDSDMGYNATFGYRFTRYFAAELGLVQLGSVESVARTRMDFGDGFVPVNLKLSFSAGGPMLSALGIVPVNDNFEFFGRVGYLFTSAERELTSRVDGQLGGFGSAKGDSQDLVLGVGVAYNFNQVYSLRLEYLKPDELGEEGQSGLEEMSMIGLGLVVRF